MNILVNGLGNIGTTLANVLLEFKDLLGLTNVYIFKNQRASWIEPDLAFLISRGAHRVDSLKSILPTIDYLFDCRAVVYDLEEHLALAPKLRGVCLQGGATKYGTLFMAEVSPSTSPPPKILRVASCNTHGISSILQLFGGQALANIKVADFVVVRRSEDLSGQDKLVGANVVVRHLDPRLGTHHAVDVQSLFSHHKSDLNITTSDVTTPSQLLHALRFNITLQTPLNHQNLPHKDTVALTQKFDSNKIFELGRRYGFQGRIYSSSIIVTSSLLITEEIIKGWAFVPQEGNTILSSLAAFLMHTTPNPTPIFTDLKKALLFEQL
jgi:glyceraldehyde-3-phosphate dehydrogenase (NAD(P))